MTEFKTIGTFRDADHDIYLDLKKSENGDLLVQIHERRPEKYCSIVLSKDGALVLSKTISDHIK